MKKKKKGREATARPPRVCGADVDTRSVVEREISMYTYMCVEERELIHPEAACLKEEE